jgi:hypothetical protein
MGALAAAPLWWGVDWSSALLAIATSVLALGVVITVVGLRSARIAALESAKARNTQVYAEISRRWDSDDLLQVRAEIDIPTVGVVQVEAARQFLRGPWRAGVSWQP